MMRFKASWKSITWMSLAREARKAREQEKQRQRLSMLSNAILYAMSAAAKRQKRQKQKWNRKRRLQSTATRTSYTIVFNSSFDYNFIYNGFI
jgi:hypothetical protein